MSLVVLVTQNKYVDPPKVDWYVQQILDEDQFVANALIRKGFVVKRVSWDDENFDWSTATAVIFRAIWDYFDRFDEFSAWLKKVETKTTVLNDPSLVWWNIDKIYLDDLQKKGIPIPPTRFLKKGTTVNLKSAIADAGWTEVVVKPNIAGAARETRRISIAQADQHEDWLNGLLENEAMMIQEFQEQILTKGEISLMVFGGKFTHAIIKTAKPGDFRVQDDFGGKVQPYSASQGEIEFAERVMNAVSPLPLYGRVDIIWDNDDELAVSEVEIIEPELWFREFPGAADIFAEVVFNHLNHLP